MVSAGVFHRANLLDPHGFRSDSVQLLGDSWQFHRSRDFKRLLPGQPERRQFGAKARHADRRRYGVERLEGILARYKQEAFQENSSIILARDPELSHHAFKVVRSTSRTSIGMGALPNRNRGRQ